jgi:8-amino-7-oxononanoate synthase
MHREDLDKLLNHRLDASGSKHRKLTNIEVYHPDRIIINQDASHQKVLNFASNDYLGLSEHKQTATLGSQPSSRLLCGNLQQHSDVEKDIADWLGYQDCLTFSTGYTANLGVLSCLAQKGDTILMDKFCHASLIDGARLSNAELKRYRHLDYTHLEELLKTCYTENTIWVVTESLFSMDGDLPDVQKLIELKQKYNFKLIVDEAHGIGVYGKYGRGWFSNFIEPSKLIDVFIFNFSKAFALQGGAVAGSHALKNFLINRCRTFIYTTATPIYQLNYIQQRLTLIKSADKEREHLKKISEQLQTDLGLKRPWSPIIPFIVGSGEKALELASLLLKNKIYCPAILPPTVREGEARLRISLNSKHLLNNIHDLAEELRGT